MKKCPNCNATPHLCQWTDTVRPNATWINCDCGFTTKTYYDKDPEKAKKKVLKIWEARVKKRIWALGSKKNRLKCCGFCGSKDLVRTKHSYLDTFNENFNPKKPQQKDGHWVECTNCGIMTEPVVMMPVGNINSSEESTKLWNW